MTCARRGSGGWLHEWKAAPCANGRQEIAYWLCNECDILKNAELLHLQRVEGAEAKLEAYAATVRARPMPADDRGKP